MESWEWVGAAEEEAEQNLGACWTPGKAETLVNCAAGAGGPGRGPASGPRYEEPSGRGSSSRKSGYTEVRAFPTPKVAAGRATRTTPGHWGATTRGSHVVRGNAQPHARDPPAVPPRWRPDRAPRNRSGLLPAARKARVRDPRGPQGAGGAQVHGEERVSRKELPGLTSLRSHTASQFKSPAALRKINPCEDKRGPTACCPSRCPNTPR
ncbi:uncharacterized protein LOC125087538 [Lutra lutra]|uniref:uncharacterized protein LOC125087538 n=1 Tax=Lutra lutra TaxID=9657 RepID=UPI001FD1C903|nr:uncharacterized protein LOC125087538 [Lutra lutra]